MVHAGGRPRTSTPTEEECILLGQDFVQWATEETEEFRCLVSQWYAQKHWMTRKQWKALIQIPQFLPYYEIGLSALSEKAIDGTMKESFGHRYIRYYDRDLREEEDQDYRDKLEREKEKIDHEVKAKASQATQDMISLDDLSEALIQKIKKEKAST